VTWLRHSSVQHLQLPGNVHISGIICWKSLHIKLAMKMMWMFQKKIIANPPHWSMVSLQNFPFALLSSTCHSHVSNGSWRSMLCVAVIGFSTAMRKLHPTYYNAIVIGLASELLKPTHIWWMMLYIFVWSLCLCRYKLSHVKPSSKSLAVSQKVSIRTDDRGLLCFQYMIPADNHTCFIEYCVSMYCCKFSATDVCLHK
jgi:hypothetical protein